MPPPLYFRTPKFPSFSFGKKKIQDTGETQVLNSEVAGGIFRIERSRSLCIRIVNFRVNYYFLCCRNKGAKSDAIRESLCIMQRFTKIINKTCKLKHNNLYWTNTLLNLVVLNM
jgi:hypothetical protein